MTTTQVADQANTGRSWMYDWTGEVPAMASSYHNAPTLLSLAGARFFGYARNRFGNLGGESNGIATSRLVGARNDKRAWWWLNETAKKSWRRDLSLQVSSLFLELKKSTTIFHPRGTLHLESTGRSWAMRNTSNVSEVE